MPHVVSTPAAYSKALLHAYRYPTQAVLGFIVGKRMVESTPTTFYVADVHPLFHSLPMTAPHPLLEVAFYQCQAAAKASGVTLLGVYFANERADDESVSPILMRPLLEWLAQRLSARPLVWILQNKFLTSTPTQLAVMSYVDMGASSPIPPAPSCRPCIGCWNSDTLEAEANSTAEAAVESLTNALEAFAHFRLMDMEEHLENPQVNYLNQSLSALMARS